MKKSFRLMILLTLFFDPAQSQNNTFPTPSGDVGVGTTSPIEKLHVAGKLFIESPYLGPGNSSGAMLKLGGYPYSPWHAGLGITQGEGVDVYDLDFYTIYGGASAKMKLTYWGGLGIGTNSPQARLHVVGGGGGNQDLIVNGRIRTGDGSNAGGVWLNASNTQFVGQINATQMGFYNNGDWRMSINDNGNVGIGTTNPTAKFQINHINKAVDIGSDGSVNTLRLFGGTAGSQVGSLCYDGQDPNNAAYGAFGIATNGSYFGTSGGVIFSSSKNGTGTQLPMKFGGYNGSEWNDWMTILTSGNIGIGTNIPGQYKLAVEGTIGARKVKVTQAAWADYVFNSGYSLLTLKEVEDYIQRYRHLPGIKSAKEIEKEGLDLGENQAALLKKIEEMTLYMIEMKKELETQRLEIIELKKQAKNNN